MRTTVSAPRKTRTPIRMAKIRRHLAAGCPSFHTRDGQSRPCNGVGCQLRLYGSLSTTARQRKADA